MSVPNQEVKIPKLASFYGRSFPRATVLLDDSNNVKGDRKDPPPSTVAPLLDWAKKAAWKEGGSRKCGVLGKAPKQPFTPLYAFLAVKQQQLQLEHPQMSSKEVLALAKADAAQEWKKLSAEETQVYFELAEGDAQRFESERARFEKLNPTFYEEQAAARKQKGSKPVGGNLPQPRAPLNPWRAFVQRKLREKLDADPSLAKEGLGLQLQISVMKDAAPLWEALTEEERQEFVSIAAEDKKRWQMDLEKYPDFKVLFEQKAAAKAAAKQKAAARRESKASRAKPTAKSEGTLARKRTRKSLSGPKAPAPARKRKAAKAGKAAVAKAQATRKPKPRQARKAAVIDEESDASESESEQELLQLSDRDSEDNNEHGHDSGEEDSDQEEQTAGSAGAKPEESAEEEDVMDLTPAPTAAQQTDEGTDEESDAESEDEFMNEDFEEEMEDDLRGVQEPEDLTQDSGLQGSQGLFGIASRVLMSGFKGVWASAKSLRKPREPPSSIPLPANMDTAGDPADGLVGRTFIKKFNGMPFVGRVEGYLPAYKWYAVAYTDGDEEELTAAALKRLLTKNVEDDPAFGPLAPGEGQKDPYAFGETATKKRKASD